VLMAKDGQVELVGPTTADRLSPAVVGAPERPAQWHWLNGSP